MGADRDMGVDKDMGYHLLCYLILKYFEIIILIKLHKTKTLEADRKTKNTFIQTFPWTM